ncbi:MAG TPA: acetate kinase [Flavobacteriia bacterium]|nr:acetate kinase [Flavobacteriia bacterium]
MKILVINSGSSSIKFQLLDMPKGEVIAKGLIERIGFKDAVVNYKTNTQDVKEIIPVLNHQQGLEQIASLLLDAKIGVINSTNDITAVGHRVVHGGNVFTETTLITPKVKKTIEEISFLAPLHNPANLLGINIAEKIFSSAKQIAVFDTAFHQTIPEKAHRYAIPNQFYDKYHVRVYGFHGTSHLYVSKIAKQLLAKEKSKLITIHLGNGCSMTAIENGKSIDHSLGFGPMNGLIMGTRSGDIDQSVILYLAQKLGYSVDEIGELLQKKSGMLGLTGKSDLRDIEAEVSNGNKMAQLALEMNAYRIKKYIGSYVAVMNGIDAIVFTAGIGENSGLIRKMVCEDMSYLGLELDKIANQIRSNKPREINTEMSKVKIFVIPTNEELEIAEQVFNLVKN